MSSPSRRWMAVLALAGLAAAAVSTFVHAQMVSDPRARQLLRHQRPGQLHPGVPEPLREHRRHPRRPRRRRVVCRDPASRPRERPRPGRVAGPCRRLSAGLVDDRPRRRHVHGVCVLLRPADRLPALPRGLRSGHRHLRSRGVGIRHAGDPASDRRRGRPRPPGAQPGRSRAGARVRCRHGGRIGLVRARGTGPGVCLCRGRRERRAGRGAADVHRSAERVRALLGGADAHGLHAAGVGAPPRRPP